MQTLGDALAEHFSGEPGPWSDAASDRRRRQALGALFAALPSARMTPEERTLQLRVFADQLADLPPLALEAAVRRLLKREDWIPRIREIREEAARLLREARWKLTGGGPGHDYRPDVGVVFDAEREIRWAASNARALDAGGQWPKLPEQVVYDMPGNREALAKAQSEGRLLDREVVETHPSGVPRIGPGGFDDAA